MTVITENTDRSLVTQGWIGDKPCLVTVDTGAYVTLARPDIAARWPERQPNQRFTLQTVSGEALPFVKEVLTVNLGRRSLKIWVLVASTTNKFILGLDILRAYGASVDVGRQTLRLVEERVSLWSPEMGLQPFSLVDPSLEARPPEGIYIDRTLARDRREVPVRILNVARLDKKLKNGSSLAHRMPVMLVTPPDVDQP
jgi:predicted aspartyl protease